MQEKFASVSKVRGRWAGSWQKLSFLHASSGILIQSHSKQALSEFELHGSEAEFLHVWSICRLLSRKDGVSQQREHLPKERTQISKTR